MYWLLLATLLITQSDGRREGRKKHALNMKKLQLVNSVEGASPGGNNKAWDAFKKLQPVLRKRGMSEGEALRRFGTFEANFKEIEKRQGKFSFTVGVSEMSVLTRKEQNAMLGVNNEMMARSQRMQIKAEPAELLAHTQDEVLRPGEVPNHLEQSIWRYISKGADKFPVSTYAEHMGGYAFISAVVIDFLNSMYSQERILDPDTGSYSIQGKIKGMGKGVMPKMADGYNLHSISRQQLINCVYRDHGFKEGSPADALQYMSNNVVMLSMKQKHHNIYYANLDLHWWDRALLSGYKEDNMDPDCIPNTMEPQDMTVMQNVTFLPGKAYINFGDSTPTTEVLDRKLNTNGEVMGEKLIKPLVYKNGAVLIGVPNCITLMAYRNGVWDYDCTLDLDHGHFAPLWLTIVGYSRTWFLLYGHPDRAHHESPLLKFSRHAAHKHVAYWDYLILPRTTKYVNCGCVNGGRCTPDNTCYCPRDKVGPKCAEDCTLTCQNGGICRGSATQCHCPEGFSGPTCEITCDCGKFGKCDAHGVCSCPRQVSWGPKCQNMCNCGGSKGYCHKDGSCECLAGKAGPKCEEDCDLSCSSPKVCRYSAKVKFCDCPFGFYGSKCDKRSDCESMDVGGSEKCTEFVNRHRCNSDVAKEVCPNACGHCLWLKQDSQHADTK